MRDNNTNNKERAVRSPGGRLLWGLCGAAAVIVAVLWGIQAETSSLVVAGPSWPEVNDVAAGELPAFERRQQALAGEDAFGEEPARLSSQRARASGKGRILVVVEDATGGSPTFQLVLAQVDEVLGEVLFQEEEFPVELGASRVISRTRPCPSDLHPDADSLAWATLHEWESEPLSAGSWMVCVYQVVEGGGYKEPLERYTESVTVRPEENVEVHFRFERDPRPVGELHGGLGGWKSPPPTLIGLWDETGRIEPWDGTGRLVGVKITSELEFDDGKPRYDKLGFRFKGLPRGQYRVGALRANSDETGWPAVFEPKLVRPPYELSIRAHRPYTWKSNRAGSWVELCPKGAGGDFHGEIVVRVIVDGQLSIHVGDYEFEDLPARVFCPSLDLYEVNWLVLIEDHLPIILDESDLEFERSPRRWTDRHRRAHIEMTPGNGFAIQLLEVTLDEIAHDSDSDRLFAGRVGLEGVELRFGEWVAGTSGLAGLLIGAEPEEEFERSAPLRLGPQWLFPVEGKWGDKGYIEEQGKVTTVPLVRR